MSGQQHYVELGSSRLLIEEYGGGENTVILLHGVTAQHTIWDRVVSRLAPELHLITVDQRGHGDSSKPATGYDASSYSEDVIALIQALRPMGSATVVGHSLGARNALVAAARRPDLIRAFVAIDFTPFIEDEVFEQLDLRVSGGARSFGSKDEVEQYLVQRYPRLPPDAITRRAEFGYETVDGVLCAKADPSAMRQTVAGLREDLVPIVRQLSVPGLFIRGDLSELVSPDAFRRTRELRPDIPGLVIADADHYVPEEKPDAVAASISAIAQGQTYSPQN